MLCILCVTASDQIIQIFDEDGLRLDVSSIISKHFWLQPNKEDCNSKIICCSCWSALHSFHKFYQKVEEAHVKLADVKLPLENDASDAEDFDTYPDFSTEDIKLETYEELKVDVSQLDFEEPVKALAVIGTEQAVKSDSDSDVPLVKLSKRVKPTRRGKNEQIATRRRLLNTKMSKEDSTDNNSDYKVPRSEEKRNITNDTEDLPTKRVPCKQFDKFLKKNTKLSCEICHVSLSTFSILKDHYQSIHNETAYVNCCDKRFESRHALVQHIMLHKNPDSFKCEKCGKILKNRKALNNHMKIHEHKKEIHKCGECARGFSRRDMLERHMEAHEKPHLICEHCGMVTRDKSVLKRHQLREHSNLPRERVPCKKCGLLLYCTGMSSHMKSQHPETKVTHVCKICGKISPTENGLRSHIRYMHQSMRRHKCSMCEKVFKAPWKLREHMTTHTGEVLYTCPHCPKTFNSNANMHSHRKKMHRKEWEENRRHPHMGSSSNAE